ncbi:hypothetical protein ACOMHN_027496 [Nucella lapillus]
MSRLLRKLTFCAKTETVSSRGSSEAECAVCQDPPVKPCMVPCGNRHVFCLACLQGIVTHNHYSTHFPCPLCRTHVRIPRRGVAAFRQGGRGRRLLRRLPALPGSRCRSPSTDSLSSVWSSADTMPPFTFPALSGDSVYTSGAEDDADSLSSLDTPSDGAAASMNLHDWLNSIDPQQVRVLEDIRMQRARAQDSPPAAAHVPHDAAATSPRRTSSSGSTSSSTVREGGARGADREEESSSVTVRGQDGWAGERGDDMGTLHSFLDELLGTEDLDMMVVLQLIANMENSPQQHAQPGDTREEGGEPHPAEQAGKSPRQVSSEATIQTTAGPPPDSPGEGAGNKDWKLRTVKFTAIPRPKLSLGQERRGSVRSQGDDDLSQSLELPAPQQASADGCGSGAVQEEEIFLNVAASDPEGQGAGQKGAVTSTDRSGSPRSAPSHTHCPSEGGWFAVTGGPQAESGSAERPHHSPPLTPTRGSQEGSGGHFSRPLPDLPCGGSPEDAPPRPGPSGRADGLTAEGWRQQELHRLQAARIRRDAESPSDDDPCPDTEVIASEGPSEWVRRVRSLQHRRRGPSSGRGVGRSLSHGGKTERADRETERETDRRRRGVEARKEARGGEWRAHTAPVGSGQEEEEDLKSSPRHHGVTYIRNLTVINL